MDAVVHPQFGQLLSVRRQSVAHLILAILLGSVGALVTLGAIGMMVRRALPVESLVAVLAAGLFLYAAWHYWSSWRTRAEFYEQGFVRRKGGRPGEGGKTLEIPYHELSQFSFHLQVHKVEGIYAGTTFTMKLRSPAAKATVSGAYKVKRRGWLKASYESQDELEGIRTLIASIMADLRELELLEGGTFDWSGQAELSAEGIRPARGPAKGQLVAYSALAGEAFGTFGYSLMAAGHAKPIVLIPVNAPNFYLGQALLGRMMSLSLPDPAPASVPVR